MNYIDGFWLPAAAVILSLFLFGLFFIKKNSNTEETKVYSKMVILNLFFSVMCVALYIYAKTVGNIFIIGIMQKIYLSVLILIVQGEYIYSLVINKSKDINVSKKTSVVLAIFFISLTFALPITTINKGAVLDLDGEAPMAAFIGIGIFLLGAMILKIKYIIKQHKITKAIPFLILLILIVIAIVLRIYYPQVITETFIVAMFMLALYNTIENPDKKMVEDLKHAKEVAAKASLAKKDFLESMSHEIRTPLNTIVGIADSLKNNNKVPEDIKEDIADILTASANLMEIVDNIIDINKIEPSNIELEEIEYKPRDEINAIAKAEQIKITNKDIKFSVSIDDDVPYELIGDKAHIKEIINNLVINSIKYTERGSIELSVKALNVGDESTLIISCQDTGRGIHKEEIDNLFLNYSNLGKDGVDIDRVGLGLALTKKLIEKMNGKINVQSSYGKGTIFVARIPQKISKLKENKTLPKENDFHEIHKVLIVDDNKLNLKVARRAMEGFNFDITEALNGAEAVELAKIKRYDLILMDIMMPVMSGEAALEKLKQIPNFSTPVIAVTADVLEQAPKKYLEKGFAAYISKPFTSEDIKEKLNEIYDKTYSKRDFDSVEGIVITGENND